MSLKFVSTFVSLSTLFSLCQAKTDTVTREFKGLQPGFFKLEWQRLGALKTVPTQIQKACNATAIEPADTAYKAVFKYCRFRDDSNFESAGTWHIKLSQPKEFSQLSEALMTCARDTLKSICGSESPVTEDDHNHAAPLGIWLTLVVISVALVVGIHFYHKHKQAGGPHERTPLVPHAAEDEELATLARAIPALVQG